MNYTGGKSRLAKGISEAILNDTDSRAEYLEPFMGGGSVFEKIAPHFAESIGSDASEDLMLMWNAVCNGWEPPAAISEEEYALLKTASPSPIRALAGFGGSFGGKWFAGYARGYTASGVERNYQGEAARSVMKFGLAVADCAKEMVRADYGDWIPVQGQVVYCDPPYAKTQGYSAVGSFDSARFWSKMDDWVSLGASVYVSEYVAPVGWECIWEREHRVSLKRVTNGKGGPMRTERLFTKRLTPLAVAA